MHFTLNSEWDEKTNNKTNKSLYLCSTQFVVGDGHNDLLFLSDFHIIHHDVQLPEDVVYKFTQRSYRIETVFFAIFEHMLKFQSRISMICITRCVCVCFGFSLFYFIFFPNSLLGFFLKSC